VLHRLALLSSEFVEAMLVIRLNREYPAGHEVRTLTESIKEMIELFLSQGCDIADVLSIVIQLDSDLFPQFWARLHLSK
jgi:hypothetical protein